MDCSGLLQLGEQCAGGGVGLVAGLVRGNSAKDLLLHLRADCGTIGNVRVVWGAGKAILTQSTALQWSKTRWQPAVFFHAGTGQTTGEACVDGSLHWCQGCWSRCQGVESRLLKYRLGM